MQKKMTTIYDIAEKTGFSAATVSRALNGKATVSDETRDAVLNAAKKMKYTPNFAARSLKTRSTKQIMLSIPHLTSAYYFQLIEAVHQLALSRGYSLILNHSHANEREELKILKSLQNNYVDGLILISINITENHLREIDRLDIPVVLSGIGTNNLDDAHRNKYDYVGVDTGKGMFLATEHLLKQGHTKIGYIGLPLDTQTGRERYQGYENALMKWGISVNPEFVICGGFTVDFGYNAGKQLCQLKEMPTAIVTTCDHICIGLYNILEEKGIRIPDDISLVGMDNTEFSAVLRPKLSSIAIASDEIGNEAGNIIFKRLDGWDGEKQSIIFDPTLVIRESSIRTARN